MTAERTIICLSCSAEITSEVPEYYIELECFRMISERGEEVPRRGSKDYHEAFERLLPEIKKKYFENSEMYEEGHRWCPKCGIRLGKEKGFGLI